MAMKDWLHLKLTAAALISLLPSQVFAAEALDLSYDAGVSAVNYQFDDQTLGGFERHKLAGGMKIRGWQVSTHTRVGQTKVNDKWGLGFVYEKDNTSYGVNHRGIQFNRRF